MGGNALKKVITVRKNKNDYEIIKKYVLEKVTKHLKCDIVLELPGKESFGDLDVLYISNPKINIKELVIDLFCPNEIVINGDVMSFDYQNFQIDFIKCNSEEDLNASQFYYSYSDIGAIIGRIVNYYGLKFGQEGIWVNLIANTLNTNEDINMTKIIGKINLTKNPQEICKYLGINFEKWNNGFLSKKEIFEWIIESKYYKKEIFYNLNYDHRRRLSLRPFYKEFLDYINININEVNISNNKYSEMKINLQKEAIIYFNKTEDVNRLIEHNKLLENRRNKFNGLMFVELGIIDKELGKIISTFKNFIKDKFNKNFEDWLDENEKKDVEIELKLFLSNLLNPANNTTNIATGT
jgi:hypothetical protein